jgi:hypothetical protein
MEFTMAFTWRVCRDGYSWVGPSRSPYLTEREGNRGCREYAPLDDHTGLFLNFASTEPTETGILAFANEYGLMGISSRDGTQFHPNERRTTWVQQIGDMRGIVGIWQQLRHRPGESIRTDRFYDMVNDHLQQSLWSTVLGRPKLEQGSRHIFDLQGSVPEAPVMRIIRASRDGKLVLEVTPTNLLGALWLQFAYAIVNDIGFRQCLSCRSWFAVSPETRRADSLYCKEACRIRAYKERKKEARRLVAAGKALGEIARELGTTTKVIRGWITESQK